MTEIYDYIIKRVSIAVNANGGSGSTNIYFYYVEENFDLENGYSSGSYTATLPTPSFTGCTFVGWEILNSSGTRVGDIHPAGTLFTQTLVGGSSPTVTTDPATIDLSSGDYTIKAIWSSVKMILDGVDMYPSEVIYNGTSLVAVMKDTTPLFSFRSVTVTYIPSVSPAGSTDKYIPFTSACGSITNSAYVNQAIKNSLKYEDTLTNLSDYYSNTVSTYFERIEPSALTTFKKTMATPTTGAQSFSFLIPAKSKYIDYITCTKYEVVSGTTTTTALGTQDKLVNIDNPTIDTSSNSGRSFPLSYSSSGSNEVYYVFTVYFKNTSGITSSSKLGVGWKLTGQNGVGFPLGMNVLGQSVNMTSNSVGDTGSVAISSINGVSSKTFTLRITQTSGLSDDFVLALSPFMVF